MVIRIEIWFSTARILKKSKLLFLFLQNPRCGWTCFLSRDDLKLFHRYLNDNPLSWRNYAAFFLKTKYKSPWCCYRYRICVYVCMYVCVWLKVYIPSFLTRLSCYLYPIYSHHFLLYRASLPNVIGSRLWFSQYAPSAASYTPLYVAAEKLPKEFTR